MNNSSIQKGMFWAQALKKYIETIKKNPASSQTGIFMKPDRAKVDGMKDANYDKLSEEGYCKVETVIRDGDVLIGMVNPKPTTREDEKPYKDSSVIYKSFAPGAIDKVITGVNNDGYPMIKIRVRSERIPVVGDKFSCYDKETEILTNSGWIYFKDLTQKHKVATLVDGNRLEYEIPSAIHKYDYNGKMYNICTNQVDLCVTPNHKMWVAPRSTSTHTKNYKLERADEIVGKHRFYQKNISQYGDELNKSAYFNLPSYMHMPERKLDMQMWLTFFGIWMAEGCVKDEWAVTFATHKPRVKHQLKLICEIFNLNIKYAWDKPGDKHQNIRNIWHINDKQFVNYFKQFNVGAINKSLPNWVWNCTTTQAKWLINGMMLGDGHTIKNGTMRYDTSSIKLANDFQKLCLHAGWSCNLKIKSLAGTNGGTIDGRTIKSTTNAYRLTIITKQNNPIANKNKAMDTWIDYNDKVYCCTVTSGVIYVRRNGIPIFSGNSRAGLTAQVNANTLASLRNSKQHNQSR